MTVASAACTRALAVLALLALASAGAAAQAFTVTGRFEYVDKPWDYDGWTGELVPRPIRLADVFVVNDLTGLVLGSGSTEQDGSFAITCLGAGLPDILVRCDADTGAAGSFQRVRVTTEASIEYAVESPVFLAHNPLLPLDIGTVTALPVTSGGKLGQPFNLLDMAVAAFELVTGPAIGAPPAPQTVRLYWPNAGGSWTTGYGAHISEDDGYDDAVILHELGHVVQNHYSHNDGYGTHSFGDSDQDPRLSFGEGYATCFGAQVQLALGLEGLYVDCAGAAPTGGVQLRLRLETAGPWAGDAFGEADEVAVACTLFDLLDDESAADATPGVDDDAFTARTLIAGLSPLVAWWGVFTGPVDATTDVALQDAWDGWLLRYPEDAHAAELEAAYAARRIRFVNDAHEPDGAPALAPLVAAGPQWHAERTLYAATAELPAPGTGDEDWLAVPLVAGDVIEVRTRYPDNAADADTECDPYVELYAPDGQLVAAAEDGGTGRNALLPSVPIGASGTWHVKVGTHSALRRYGQYEVRVRYLSENHPPQLLSGPTAFPATLVGGESAELSALAVDPDGDPALTYAWTPLDGGLIVGAGPVVSFVPPAVLAPATARVQLVVSDSLGAGTPPAEVVLELLPAVGGTCQAMAAVTAVGRGKPGLGGTPELVAQGLPVVPSYAFAARATGLTPGLPGFVIFGFSAIAVPFDLGTLHAAPDLLMPAVPDAAGELAIPMVLPPEPQLCGLSVVLQVIVPDDPGAAGSKQTAQSNGLIVTFGN